MGVIALLFMLAAIVLFLVAAFAPIGKPNLVALGLACLSLALLLQGVGDVSVRTD